MGATPIQRPLYLERIRPFIGRNLIKVITGQRRVGKSFLMLQLMELLRGDDPNANIVCIDMESHEFSSIRNDEDLVAYVASRAKLAGNYLFIDEVQEIVGFERALRHFHGSGDWDIYCTGSNASMLSSDIATLLSGRALDFRVYPLSYAEFLTFHGLEDGDEAFSSYLRYGGLPYLIHLERTDEVVYEYERNIYTTILYRDVVSRYGVRNTFFLERLVEFLCDNVGSIISAKRISDLLRSQRVNISPPVVMSYLAHSTDAFLVHKGQRSEIGGRRIFEIGEKYYVSDQGLRNAVIGYNPSDVGKTLPQRRVAMDRGRYIYSPIFGANMKAPVPRSHSTPSTHLRMTCSTPSSV